MYLTWLDSNSWLIEMGSKRILLDPWLVGPLVFGNAPWLFKGERNQPQSIPDNIDLILLSQGLEDHAHPQTLKALNREIPVVASPNAAKVVRGLGYSQVTELPHGTTHTIGDLQIRALPGSPIGPSLVENAYILQDTAAQTSLYYEPHGFHSSTLTEFAPVDVVVTPIINLTLPLLGPIIKGQQSAMDAAKMLRPRFILPTAAGGDVSFDGLLLKLLRAEGSADDLRQSLAAANLEAELLEPRPGDRTFVDLRPAQTA
jgi:L-ascorbate metabolism protein UlaG (beta-lactamase superfamily)